MSKKIDLNAPRNNSQDHKKSRMNHSFSHTLPYKNEKNNQNSEGLTDELNNNQQNQDEYNNKPANNNAKTTANSIKNKIASKAISTITGAPKGLTDKALELSEKGNGIIRMPITIKLFPIIIILGSFLVFLMLFVVLFTGEDNIKNSGIGINGYAYYDGSICENVNVDGELMDIDEYVAGVIANEVNGFPEESLRAFAIAARTYIVATGTKVGSDRNNCYYKTINSTAAQTFSKAKTTEQYINAANDTKGIIITVDGKPSNFYDASCVYTASQAQNADPDGNYNDSNYYIKYGSLTIGGTNFQTIPKSIMSTNNIGSLNYYANQAETKGACSGNHGYGMSQNGSYYLEAIENYDWEKIIDYYYNNKEELLSIYESVGTIEYSSEYPIDPNHKLYSNLKFLIDEPLSQYLSKKGTSVAAFNEYISSSVDNVGVKTRNATVTAAVNLIGYLATTGVKLNYQWGGKYATIGVNPNWGTEANMGWLCGPASYGSLYDSSVCYNNYKWNSFDCSGFVTWAIINGMKNSSITQSQIENSTRTTLNANEAVCKPGGILRKPGSHIVLVIGTDDANKRYIVAESTGSRISSNTGGVKLSYYSYDKSGYYCSNLNEIYGD